MQKISFDFFIILKKESLKLKLNSGFKTFCFLLFKYLKLNHHFCTFPRLFINNKGSFLQTAATKINLKHMVKVSIYLVFIFVKFYSLSIFLN